MLPTIFNGSNGRVNAREDKKDQNLHHLHLVLLQAPQAPNKENAIKKGKNIGKNTVTAKSTRTNTKNVHAQREEKGKTEMK